MNRNTMYEYRHCIDRIVKVWLFICMISTRILEEYSYYFYFVQFVFVGTEDDFCSLIIK